MSLLGNKLKNQIIFCTGTVLVRASSFIEELHETLVDQITSKEFIDSYVDPRKHNKLTRHGT